jgi:hypothetical protein
VHATVIAVGAIHIAAMLFLERDSRPATVPPSPDPGLRSAESEIAAPPVMSR